MRSHHLGSSSGWLKGKFVHGINMAILLPMWGTVRSPRTVHGWGISLTKINRTRRLRGRRADVKVSCRFPTDQFPSYNINHLLDWNGRQSQSVKHSSGTITIMLNTICSQGWHASVGGSILGLVHFLTTCLEGRDIGNFLAMESIYLTSQRVECYKHDETKTRLWAEPRISQKRGWGLAMAFLLFPCVISSHHLG